VSTGLPAKQNPHKGDECAKTLTWNLKNQQPADRFFFSIEKQLKENRGQLKTKS
jgi:hypothetical protein